MKKEYNVLEEVFIEEYDRVIRRIAAIQNEIISLPKGSISRKTINGYEAYYLCYREGNKVKSKYIKKSELEELKSKVARRREYEAIFKESKIMKKQLEKALGKELLNEYKTRKGIY